ncbi:DUF3000 domain-containing protein [Arthrobacter sp. 35W]|uniref:DUF3000 domain-containing protein n=1 Tax=Arthrobacter sp. 35W TaxID=1132441 RepID=UPI0006862C9C|nr:DUF3000 domain-containing protein [Arthrobacter sp. 35W]
MVSALAQLPSDFLTALASLREGRCRPELRLSELPAPARLAPFSVALEAEVAPAPAPGLHVVGSHQPLHLPPASAVTGEPELATGRFILLHDPAGSTIWDGTFRIVTYIRAQLEAELGNDQMLGSVAWTWLVDALENHDAGYREAGGTATRILSESFGTLSERADSIDIELRASWTPDGPDVQAHLEAWSDMVCTFAGLPPLPEGVSALPRLRRN